MDRRKTSRFRQQLRPDHNPPLCHPERTRISYITALTSATYVVLRKENHMLLTEAASLDRKSGEAEGSAVFYRGQGRCLDASVPARFVSASALICA
jgi:hypothetical protein